MSDQTQISIVRRSLTDPEDRSWLQDLSPSERIALVWRLTLQAWAFKGLDHEPRLRRDVVRLVRCGS